jgi:hypothetical protein
MRDVDRKRQHGHHQAGLSSIRLPGHPQTATHGNENYTWRRTLRHLRDTLSVRIHARQRSVNHYGSFECLLVSVDVGSHSKDCDTVAIVYRPPSSSLEQFYDDFSDLLVKVGDIIDIDRFVAFGDFNCGSIDPTSIRTDLISLLDVHDLQQLVAFATRTTLTTCSLLDLVINRAGSSRVS